MVQRATAWFWFLAAVATILLVMFGTARSEPVVLERVVPPGATLTYSVNGVPIHVQPVPEGRVRVTIEYYGAASAPRHHHTHQNQHQKRK